MLFSHTQKGSPLGWACIVLHYQKGRPEGDSEFMEFEKFGDPFKGGYGYEIRCSVWKGL